MAIAIAKQPEGIVNCLSPVYYKFTGLSPDNTYTISIFIDNVKYIELDRTPNITNDIVIDVHIVLKNYLDKILEYGVNKSISAYCILSEFVGDMLNSTTSTDVVIAVLGSTTYNEGINYSHGELYPACSDPDIIELPNYGAANNYNLTFIQSLTLSPNAWWGITYFDKWGTFHNLYEPFDSNATIQKIPCGYMDLVDYYGVSGDTIDYNRQIIVHIYRGSNPIKKYTIKPIVDNCNELCYFKFLNRFGAWDKFFIYGRIDKSTSINYDTYNYNNLDYSTMDYARNGSYHKFMSNGKTLLTINTGWVSEGLNEKIDQIMISDHVYFNDMPIIITSKDMQFKTHKWDKLINYTITAEYTFDKINNI